MEWLEFFWWFPLESRADKFTPGDIRASKLDYDIIRGYGRETAKLIEKLKHAELSAAKRFRAADWKNDLLHGRLSHYSKATLTITLRKTAEIIPFPTVNRIALWAINKRDSE